MEKEHEKLNPNKPEGGCRRLGGSGRGLGHGHGMGRGMGRGAQGLSEGRGQGMGQGPCRRKSNE